MPDLESPGRRQERDDGDDGAVEHIRGEHNSEAEQPVDHDTADQKEQNHRKEADDEDHAHGRRRAGLLEYPPRQSDTVQAVAKARDHLAGPQQGKGARAQGDEE